MKYLTLDRGIFVAIILCLLFLMKCQADKLKIAGSTITSEQLANQKLDSMNNALGQKVLTQEVLVAANQESLRKLTDSVFNLKKSQDKKIKEVIAYYSSISKTEIRERLVPYIDTIKTKKFSDSLEKVCQEVIKFYEDSSILVPQPVKDSGQHFVFKGTVKKEGLQIEQVSFPDSLYLRFVEKGGFLKKRTVEVQVLHTNPYINVTSSNSVIYKPPAKARWLERALILAAGIFIGTKL